jgi:hypothetical protein
MLRAGCTDAGDTSADRLAAAMANRALTIARRRRSVIVMRIVGIT